MDVWGGVEFNLGQCLQGDEGHHHHHQSVVINNIVLR